MTTKSLPSRSRKYDRCSLSNQLAELLANRSLGLISRRELEGQLAVIQLGLPAGYIIKMIPLRGGGTGFLVHDMNALQEVDRFDFPHSASSPFRPS